jgi:hypothetical protein
MADVVYSAAEIIDKTLIAQMQVPVYRFPNDREQPIGYIQKGQPVGIVNAWIAADPTHDRTGLWWQFYPTNNYSSFYYAPHKAEYYNIGALKEQGVLTEKEKEEAKKDEDKEWYEKLAEKAIPVIVITVLGAAVIKGLLSQRNY